MNEHNSFLKHFFRIGSGSIASIALSVIFTPIITRLVSPDIYGRYSVFLMCSTIAVMILCMGMDQSLVRYYYEEDTVAYKKSLLLSCIKLPIISCIVIGAIITLASYIGYFNVTSSHEYMLLLSICVLFQLIYRFGLLVVRLEYKSGLFARLNVINKAIYIVVSILILLYFKSNQLYVLICSVIISEIICSIICIISQRELLNIRINHTYSDRINKRTLYRYGLPYILSMSVTMLLQYADVLSLKFFTDATIVGIYSSGLAIVRIFSVVQTSFTTIWGPAAIEHYSRDREDRSFYIKANKTITVVMFLIGLSLVVFKDLIIFFLGEKYREAVSVIPFLVFEPIMFTISETTVQGLVFKEKSKYHILIGIITCIINLIGNIILIPRIGYRGAAISTGCSYVIFFILRTFISNHFYKIDFQIHKIFIVLVLSIAFCFYNTWHQFDIYILLGYLVCVSMVFILFGDVIKQGLSMAKSTILRKR